MSVRSPGQWPTAPCCFTPSPASMRATRPAPDSQQMRTLIQQDFAQAFERVDVIVGPTVPIVAPPIGRTFEPGGALNVPPRSVANRTTVPCNLTGMPAISLPCGFSDGLPVGLQIMGPAFAEALVLRIAAAYEAATPWRQSRPADPELADAM